MLAQAASTSENPIVQLINPTPLAETNPIMDFRSKLIASLYESCDEDTANQLETVDVVMERLYKLGYDNKHRKKLPKIHGIYSAGNELLAMTKKIYTHNLSAEECQKIVDNVDRILTNSKIDID